MPIHNLVEVKRAWLYRKQSLFLSCLSKSSKIVKGIPNILKFPIWTVVTNAIPITFRQKKKKVINQPYGAVQLLVSYCCCVAGLSERGGGTRGGPPQILTDKLTPSLPGWGQIMPTTLLPPPPLGFSNLPTALCWYNTIILHIEQF